MSFLNVLKLINFRLYCYLFTQLISIEFTLPVYLLLMINLTRSIMANKNWLSFMS